MGRSVFVFCLFFYLFVIQANATIYFIHANDPKYLELSFFNPEPQGGDTIYIDSDRSTAITFIGLTGDQNHPIVIMNYKGQVIIDDPDEWSALLFKNCAFVKLSGAGDDQTHYGFKLSAKYSGVNIGTQSTNFEIAFIEVDHKGFAGIQVKDDYGGDPPDPLPEFRELVIHDCLVQNVTEGMYLGETKSPGLEFRYVRIFNNVIRNTGREGIQIANMVEDVQIYNNVIVNSGTDFLAGQGNNLQIGDNSVADIFNNIFSGAYQFGIIVFGMGHINITSNYIENSQGIFVDNRLFTDLYSSIDIRGNYFVNMMNESVIINYNEINFVNVSDNFYQGELRFYRSNCSECTNTTLANNINTTLSIFDFEFDDEGNFTSGTGNPPEYDGFGSVATQLFTFNSWPEFDQLTDLYVNQGDIFELVIACYTHDNDELEIQFTQLPDFVTVVPLENGKVKLIVDAQNQPVAIYNVLASAQDKSHQVKVIAPFKVVVRKADNHSPEILIDKEFYFQSLSKNSINFTIEDLDEDELSVEMEGEQDFIHLLKGLKNAYQLVVEAEYWDTGTYTLNIKADDGYAGTHEIELAIHISPKELLPGVVLYRYNFGGPELYGLPINWTAGNELLYPVTEQNLQNTGSYAWKGTNETNAPDSLFGPYSYLKSDTQNVDFNFPCEPNEYLISLYFTKSQLDYDSFGESKIQVFAEGNLMSNVVLGETLISKAYAVNFKVVLKDSVLNLILVPKQNFVKINGLQISVALPMDFEESSELPRAFPNPFHDDFYIVNTAADPLMEWSLYNSAGKLLKSEKLSEEFLPLRLLSIDGLQQGYYFLRMKTQNKFRVQKVVCY
ncbi:MAG: T9SS type A sorting domain-containing protein [Prolixibacteraceae bacterium]